MKTIITIILLSLWLTSHIEAEPNTLKETPLLMQDRTYQKKTLVHPNSVYQLQPGIMNTPVDTAAMVTLLEQQLSGDRFFSNTIPSSLMSKFNDKVTSETQLTQDQLMTYLNTFLGPVMLEQLLDEQLQAQRITQDDDQSFSLAETKGKTDTVTLLAMKQYMNATFFYFPYITKSTISITTLTPPESDQRTSTDQQHKKNRQQNVKKQHNHKQAKNDKKEVQKVLKQYQYHLSAGIIWFQFKVDETGQYQFVKIAHMTSKRDKHKKVYGKRVLKEVVTTLKQAALKEVTESLTLQSHFLPAFQIQGRVMAHNGTHYDLGIYAEEGVKLDNYYHTIENVEKGHNIVSRKVGLIRIHKPPKTRTEPGYTSATHVLGNLQRLPSWVIEDRRLNLDLSFGWTQIKDILIDKSDSTIAAMNMTLMDDSVTEMTGLYMNLDYNLATILKRPQYFFTVYGRVAFPHITLNLGKDPVYMDITCGLRKKFWYRSISMHASTGLSYAHFEFDGGFSELNYYRQTTLGLNWQISLEKLWAPRWSTALFYEQFIPFKRPQIEYAFNGYTTYENATQSHLNYSGTGIRIIIQF